MTQGPRTLPTLLVWTAVAVSQAVAAPAASVHLEIVQEAGGSVDVPQRWLQQLQRLSLASLRLRTARQGDRPLLETRSTADQPTYYVTAVLTSRGELKVPNATFRLGEAQRFATWVDNLRPPGQTLASPAPENDGLAFDLTARELVQLRKDLGTDFPLTTRDLSVQRVVDELQARTALAIVIDATAREPLSTAPAVRDELKGLAHGTVLAAALRPAGLAVVPERDESRRVRLRIVRASSVEKVWPIGWPSQQNEAQTIPKLLELVPVEIADTPLSRAVAAIQPRLGVPVLLDHNGLAARGIDIETVKVRHSAGRTTYRRLLGRLLFQALLDMDVRVDDGDRPFIWIRPVQR